MPTSTAATVTRASSPGSSPATLIGRPASPRGRICAGARDLDLERARAAVDLEPGEPERAARACASRLRVERPMRERDEIGAGAPLGLDRHASPSCRRRRRRRRGCRAPCRRRPRASPCRRSAASRRTRHRRRPSRSSPCRASCRGGRACRRSGRRDQPTVNDTLVCAALDADRRARRGGTMPHSTGVAMRAGSSAATSTRPSRDAAASISTGSKPQRPSLLNHW